MKINADREVCVGAGNCVLTAGELFDQDEEDGRVVVLVAQPGEDQQKAAAEAVEMCPSGALSIE